LPCPPFFKISLYNLYEDFNNEFLTNWKVITDDINDKLEKVINELTDQFTEYDKNKVQFIDETKCKTRDMMLECNEDIDADFLINSKLAEIYSNFEEENFPIVFNKIRNCIKKNKEIIRILGDIFLVLISVKEQQKEHVNGIEQTVEEKIGKDYEESKKEIITRKDELSHEIENLKKTEFEPNITNKYNQIKEILKNYENDYHKVIETIENDLKLCNVEVNSCFDEYKNTIFKIFNLN